jgi:hypothetical protein
MRTLGPGSVSSFLKIVVEVVYVALGVATAALLISGLALLVLLPFSGALIKAHLDAVSSAGGEVRPLHIPALPLALLAVAAYAGGLVVVFNRLRRVFETLTLGDPFHPENVTRLRVIGLALIGLEALGNLMRMALAAAFPQRTFAGLSLNLTAWFAILVVFVLAEVFREGARLRQEAELTI